jgi:hypothetical protein
MAGTWSLTLDTDGGLSLIAPPAFESPTVSGSFQLHRSVFTTNTFADAKCRGTVGTYRWGLSDGRLRFTKIDDPCSIREALFGARIWDSVRSSAAPDPLSGGVTFLPDDGSSLAAGPYATTFQPPMQLTISGRWTGNSDTADFTAIQKGSSDADWAISFFRIEHVFDPRTHSEVPVPQDLVGWFTSHPAIHVITPPQPTTIGGLSAT